MKKKTTQILFFLFTGLVVAQDPQFSQFFSNQLLLAPSFAGGSDRSRVSSSYRTQWLNISGNGGVYKTYYTSYDHYFSNFNSGIGVIFLKDVAGTANYGTTELSLLYSYNLKVLNIWYVRPGINFTYGQFSLDQDQLIYSNQVDPTLPVDDNTYSFEPVSYLDAAASVLVYSKKVWFGFNVNHLLSPHLNLMGDEIDKAMGVTLFAGGEVIKYSRLLKPIDETLNLAGQLRLYNTQKQFDIGLYWYKHPLILGLWYRGIPLVNSQRGDALIPLIGFKNNWFYVGYSYDFTLSNLISHTRGSHEISMNFKFKPPPRRQKLGAVPCPHF